MVVITDFGKGRKYSNIIIHCNDKLVPVNVQSVILKSQKGNEG
jgi:hypothetical protein